MRIKDAFSRIDAEERQVGRKPGVNWFEKTIREGVIVMLDTMPDGTPAIIVNDGVSHLRIPVPAGIVEKLVSEYLAKAAMNDGARHEGAVVHGGNSPPDRRNLAALR